MQPLILEILAFALQSLAAVLSLFVFLKNFRRLWLYNAPAVRRRFVHILAYQLWSTICPATRLSIPPDDDVTEDVRLATKSVSISLMTILSWYILVLRTVFHLKGGFQNTDLMYEFLAFHILLGLLGTSISVNVMAYFYRARH